MGNFLYKITAFALGLILAWHLQAIAQQNFSTPEEAVQVVVDAARNNNRDRLQEVFGPDAALIMAGDEVMEDAEFQAFSAALDQQVQLIQDQPDRITLLIGNDKQPFAVPLIKQGNQWLFDTATGKTIILQRRIEENELETIKSSLLYVQAQKTYQQTDRDGDQILEYAQQFLSTPGQQDGLFWEADDQGVSPLAALVIRARLEGYSSADQPDAATMPIFHGYIFRILTQQGTGTGEVINYFQGENLTEGFALLAYPVKWGSSGRRSFLINQEGKLYAKDLGDQTTELALSINSYTPDNSWSLIQN